MRKKILILSCLFMLSSIAYAGDTRTHKEVNAQAFPNKVTREITIEVIAAYFQEKVSKPAVAAVCKQFEKLFASRDKIKLFNESLNATGYEGVEFTFVDGKKCSVTVLLRVGERFDAILRSLFMRYSQYEF